MKDLFVPYDSKKHISNGYYVVRTISGREVKAYYKEGNWSIPDHDEKITHIVAIPDQF